MATWILAALVGGLLSLLGFRTLLRQFGRGEVRGRYVLAFGVGYVSLACYALVSALRPAAVDGPVTLVMLLPAFVAIVVLVREHQRASKR